MRHSQRRRRRALGARRVLVVTLDFAGVVDDRAAVDTLDAGARSERARGDIERADHGRQRRVPRVHLEHQPREGALHRHRVRRVGHRDLIPECRLRRERRPLVGRAEDNRDLSHAHRRAPAPRPAALQRDVARRVVERQQRARRVTRLLLRRNRDHASRLRVGRGLGPKDRRFRWYRRRRDCRAPHRRPARRRSGPLRLAASSRRSGAVDALGGIRPQRIVAIGESQSAFQLTTYINAIQPTARIFDGFFVHSRGGGAIPISGGNIATGINGGVRIRDDIDVPVFLFETETDETLLRYFDARQPDSPHIRLWDVAGAAHADAFIVGGNAGIVGCKGAINTAPTHYVVAAALNQLDEWLRTGVPPASAPRLKVTIVKGAPTLERDALGNALGGVRTAANDVPVAALSSIPSDSSKVLCGLFGSTRAFDHATLVRLYKNQASYVAAFRRATDKAITNGYVVPADRAAILTDAAKVAI